MAELKFPHLFTPARVRGAYFRNRLMSAPQGNYNVSRDRLAGEEVVAFYERKAIGGYASVAVGDCVIEVRTGKNLPWLFDMEDIENLGRMSMVTQAITRNGALASAELAHDGHYSIASKEEYGCKLYGPVECENRYGHVEEMSEEMILRLIDKYEKSAAYAMRCGFNMITIHAGHGWGPAQFMSSKINTRKDKWGGSFENRMRYPLAVIDAVRRGVGERVPIEFRFSGSEVTELGYDINEGVEIAKALDGKVDIIHVSAGIHEVPRTFPVVHPSMFLEDGCNSKYAREIKKNVTKSLVATVGAFTDPAHMEEFIASGGADFIAMARQSLADPDFPNKARCGRDDEIARCIRCNKCFQNVGRQRIFRCALNPEIGQEMEAKMEPPVLTKKKVLVAGGGIAGMEAAIQCAKRGHQVILCEKTDALGGTLRCEHKVPFKKNIPVYIDRQARLCEVYGVDVRLNTPVTPELAESIAPDVIIAALGARPVVPPIPGIEKATGAEAVYENPDLAGKNVVILGAGLVGIELAIWLGQLGKKVHIVEMADKAGVDLADQAMSHYAFAMEDNGVEMHLNTKALVVSEGGVDCSCFANPVYYEADTIIYAVGQRPLYDDADALRTCAPEFYAIGDCIAPDSILAATKQAWGISRALGRF